MEIQENCVICHIGMKRKKVVRVLPCRHLLHEDCFNHVTESICPICRQEATGSEIVERTHYKKHSAQDRARVVETANRGDDWTLLASSLGVNYKTAFSWVNSGRSEVMKRGGNKPKSLSEELINRMLEWIEENSTITLKTRKCKILREYQREVSTSTIANYLEGRLFTMKSVHRQPVTMNSPQNKEKRAEYVSALNEFIRAGKQVVFVDETNFNLFCRRNRGHAKAGARAVQILPASRGPNIHLIGAIAASGVISMERRRGSFKAVDASNWIKTILEKWINLGNNLSDLVIVCDNAPCHTMFERALNEFHHAQKATLLCLGPYSPMLNPIEIIWSKVKTYVKANMGIPTTSGVGIIEQRLNYLETLIDDAKLTVTGGDCGRAIQHTTTFHADALSMHDMPVGT